jgi:hypothetical protein
MRLPAALLALLPLAALGTACGSSSAAASDPVAKAATASANTKAEHMHIDSKVTANGSTVSVQGDGDFQNRPLLGSMAVTATVGVHDVSLSEIASGSKVYLTSPLFNGQIPGGKKWMSIDYGKVAKAVGVSIVGAASQSPSDALQELQASGKAKQVGEETLGGVHTTHWVATLDPKKLAQLHTAATFEPVDVWIDDQGHVRKTHAVGTVAAHGTTPAVTTDTTVSLSDYGEAVHVTVPPASATYDATALATQQATTTTGGTP